MPPRPLKRPAHIPPLSSLLSAGQPLSTGGSPVPLSASPFLVRPAHVALVLDDTYAQNDRSGQRGWGPNIVIGKQPGGKVTQLSGVVLRSSKNSIEDTSASGFKTVTVKVLDKHPPTFPTEGQQKHFALPLIPTDEPIRDNLPAWLDALSVASKNEYTVEITLEAYGNQAPPSSGQDQLVAGQYEQIEELLSKAYSHDFDIFNLKKGEVKSDEDAHADEIKGARFILDAFGGPPTHWTSSQLLRSTQLQDWSGFCSRLALHPRVYVKLSPPVASLRKSGGLKALDKEARAEFRRIVRIWIDAVLDALGDERLIFAATGLDPGNLCTSDKPTSKGDMPAVVAVGDADESLVERTQAIALEQETKEAQEKREDEALTEVELWFEIVREVLADIGVDSLAMSKIFEGNAQKLYGL
ncbi:hypothetical protein OC846_000341 [Tilletia horrida]|uniref:Uncharacterized protein n=1 Tax=Tilletia horrida TaxID=155126 RepID=A0AAN6GUY4_9BASI|nr:hypothetical protein OC846_000341 [Tilletia horrida]